MVRGVGAHRGAPTPVHPFGERRRGHLSAKGFVHETEGTAGRSLLVGPAHPGRLRRLRRVEHPQCEPRQLPGRRHGQQPEREGEGPGHHLRRAEGRHRDGADPAGPDHDDRPERDLLHRHLVDHERPGHAFAHAVQVRPRVQADDPGPRPGTNLGSHNSNYTPVEVHEFCLRVL